MIQIIVVSLDGERIDCKVQGSSLTPAQYGDAIALIIRSVAGLFASHSTVTEAQVVEEILRVVDDKGRIVVSTENHHLH